MFDTSSTVRIAVSLVVGALVLLGLSGTAAMGGDDTETDHLGVGSSTHAYERVVANDTRTTAAGSHEVTGTAKASIVGCVFDPRYLPRTPDAIEGWYRSCRFVAKQAGGCQFDPRYLPRTPDAVEGWYGSCS